MPSINDTLHTQEHYAIHNFNLACYFITFSAIGTLLRLGLLYLFGFQGTPLTAIAIPQILGCMLHGLFYNHPFLLKFPDVFLGLTVGLNGSITSFSAWMNATAMEFVNYGKMDRSIFSNILAGFLDISVIYALCFGSFLMMHQALNKNDLQDWKWEALWIRLFVKNPFLTQIGLGVLSFAIVTSLCMVMIFSPSKEMAMASLLGPLGTGLRYFFAKWNQRTRLSFPFLGTFTTNVLGCIILSLVIVGKWAFEKNPSSWAYIMMSAVGDGFCGCLTTISTFIGELWVLERKQRWQYAVSSIGSGLLPLFLVYLILKFI